MISWDGYVDRAFSDLSSYFLQASYVTEKTLIKALAFGGNEETYQSWYGLTAEELEDDRRQNPYTYENEVDNSEIENSDVFTEQNSQSKTISYQQGEIIEGDFKQKD